MNCGECIHFEVCGKAIPKHEICGYGSCRHFEKKPQIKIGDPIYYVYDSDDDGIYKIEELRVTEVGMTRVFTSAFNPPEDDFGTDIPFEEIGDTFFLAREDAEDAVRKAEENRKKSREERF